MPVPVRRSGLDMNRHLIRLAAGGEPDEVLLNFAAAGRPLAVCQYRQPCIVMVSAAVILLMSFPP